MEYNTTKTIHVVICRVILGSKKMNKLKETCGKLLLHSKRYDNNTWELTTLSKNAKKFVKTILSFFEEEGISHFTKDKKDSRFLLPYCKEVFSTSWAKELGLGITPIGYVFNDLTETVKKNLEPTIPEEDIAFKEFDRQVNEVLTKFREARKVTAKKWLELTTYNSKTSEV